MSDSLQLKQRVIWLLTGHDMDCSTPGFPVLCCLPEFAQTRIHWVSDAIQSSHLCHLLLLLPLIFVSITVFSNELALCIRWLKYWIFSFSISPSNEYSGLISFRIDWLENSLLIKMITEPWREIFLELYIM